MAVISAVFVGSAAAQEPELDKFIYLPVVIKSPPSSSQPAVTILPNLLFFESDLHLNIYGEVQNTGGTDVHGVEVVANLFNSGGQLIDISYGGDAALWVLPPGEKTCFTLYFDEYDNWAYYEFEPPNFDSDPWSPLENMVITEYSTYYPDENRFRILGFVRNDNDYLVKYVQPIATLYDGAGTVIGCGWTFVSSDNLDPGQSSSFELNFFGETSINYANVASYRMQVDGWLWNIE
jgi:hypothetical protein